MTNLYSLLSKVNGNNIISINTNTIPTLKGGKKNVMLGKVSKITDKSNVMVFQNKNINGYESMVKRRLEKEGKSMNDFVLGERKWGIRIPNTPFITHKNELYLEVIFLRCGEVSYVYEGEVIDKDEVIGLNENKTEAHQGDLTNKVIIRTFKCSNITGIVIDGKCYNDLECTVD